MRYLTTLKLRSYLVCFHLARYHTAFSIFNSFEERFIATLAFYLHQAEPTKCPATLSALIVRVISKLMVARGCLVAAALVAESALALVSRFGTAWARRHSSFGCKSHRCCRRVVRHSPDLTRLVRLHFGAGLSSSTVASPATARANLGLILKVCRRAYLSIFATAAIITRRGNTWRMIRRSEDRVAD